MKRLALALVVSLVGLVGAQTTLTYSLWDTNQLPAYEQCAADFTEETGVNVEIEQLGWGDYWSNIQTGFVSGEAPDVFTNHLARYPEFAALGQLMDIQPMLEADNVDTDLYIEGLADLWIRDGERYGLPKDFDTIAMIFNRDMVEAAGITEEELNSMSWNSEDGGTFEEIIARLTLDADGNNGLSPDFDSDNVVQYGFGNSFPQSGAYGQTEWSWLAVANGFTFNNGVWGDEYYYDDPALAEALQWMVNLWLEKGYAPPAEAQSNDGAKATLFQSGTVAMVPDGSWMIGTYLDSEFPVGFARLPMVDGQRKSMFNGLADSIWTGTEHPEEAWEWVKYLASPACINVIGASGVVLPSTEEGVELSLAVREEAGVDVSAFTNQATEEGGTFLFPITDFGSEINTIMSEAIQSMGLGEGTAAELLQEANEEVNDLF